MCSSGVSNIRAQGAGPLSISRIREAGLVDYSELRACTSFLRQLPLSFSKGGAGVQAQCDYIFQFFSPKLANLYEMS